MRKLIYGLVTVVATSLLSGDTTKADHSPYGRRTHFPKNFYGRTIPLEQLNPELEKAYLSGYTTEDIILKVLDGKIQNIKPLTPNIR